MIRDGLTFDAFHFNVRLIPHPALHKPRGCAFLKTPGKLNPLHIVRDQFHCWQFISSIRPT
jgi:hypothetical protein